MLKPQHPTSLIVAPSAQWGAIVAALREGVHAADFWAPADLVKQPSLAEVRSLRQFALHTAVGERKLACLPGCERLSREVANSLLKLLEEPPSHFYTVLLATADTLLPTVRSRTFSMALPPGFATMAAGAELSREQEWGKLLGSFDLADPSQRLAAQRLLYRYPLVHTGIKDGPLLEAFTSYPSL